MQQLENSNREFEAKLQSLQENKELESKKLKKETEIFYDTEIK